MGLRKSDYERGEVEVHQGRPVSMQVLMKDLCRSWGIEKKIREYRVLFMWPQIVGKKIAQKTRPLGIEKGKLFLYVENSSWRNELTFLKQDIVEKINRSAGTKIVHDIICCNDKGVHTRNG